MKIGKVSENVMKRSVFRQLHTQNERIISGAVPGEDCAVLAVGGDRILLTVDPAQGQGEDAALCGIHRAVNNIAACGGEPEAVLLSVLLPPDCEESSLRSLMARAEEVCAGLHVQIAGGHTQVTGAVNRIVLTVTGIGRAASPIWTRTAEPDADLVVTKWVGLEGTFLAAREREALLLERFPAYLVEEAAGFDRYLSIVPEAAVAVKSGVWAMTDVSRGGIFGALWEMAESSGVGLSIDLKKLPIRQETVEICNYLDLNPYELLSGGSLLIAASRGEDLVRELEAAGIPAAVVGKTTAGKDRLIFSGDEKRFLEPAKPDQIHKI